MFEGYFRSVADGFMRDSEMNQGISRDLREVPEDSVSVSRQVLEGVSSTSRVSEGFHECLGIFLCIFFF